MRGGIMAKKMIALPSLVIKPDGSQKKIDDFSDKEHEKWSEQICQKIGRAISDYYTDDTEGWNIFVRKMTS